MKINWKKTEIQSDIGSNNIIDAYGDGGFTVSGKKIKGSICLFPDGWCYWQVEHPENIRTPRSYAQSRFAHIVI